MLPTESIKPFRIVKASDVGIRGTVLEQIIKDKRCLICGNFADREVWIYEHTGQESTNKVKQTTAACSDECAEMTAWRSQ